MAIEIKCRCGRRYRVKEEHAGKTVKCNHCAHKMRVPEAAAMQPDLRPPLDDDDLFTAPQGALRPPLDDEDLYAPKPSSAKIEAKPSPRTPALDPVFDRDFFQLKIKPTRMIRERFEVLDEDGDLLMAVERPARMGRAALRIFFMAIVPGILATAIFAGIILYAEHAKIPVDRALGPQTCILVGIFLLAFVLVAGIALSITRDIFVYRGSSRSETLLQLQETKGLRMSSNEYTVHLPNGTQLARLKKDSFLKSFCQRWRCFGPGGGLLCLAVESPAIVGVFRRIPILSLLYLTTFVIRDARSEQTIGKLKRGMFGKYKLDLSDDPERAFDRRVLLALAVMLDFGEYRPHT
jgi:hypothetical protein